jgi:hypothetical protein
MVNWPWSKTRTIEYAKASGYKASESDKGQTVTSYEYNTDVIRLPHPDNMGNYERWGKDPESRVALEVLNNIITGVGYYTEMPEEFQPKEGEKDHPNKVKIDDYGEDVNLDEKMQQINYQTMHKGFCPVEIYESNDSLYDLRVLPSETFFKYVDKKGTVLKYTQERSRNDIVTTWEGADLGSIVWFQFGYGHYGMSLLEPIGDLLDSRAEMNIDMPKAVHRWAYPIPFLETSGSSAILKDYVENRDVDDWIIIGNVNKDEVRMNTLAIDPQARFIPYIELVYYQICEGLHAPLLLYLKNATEASATVMMESVDRLVNGRQRYNKRRMEHYLFKQQVRDPVPRVMWGQPKTGLEDVTLTDVASIINSPSVANNQVQWILKQYWSSIPEPDWSEEAKIAKQKNPFPQQPFGQQPFQKKPAGQEVPVEQLVERLNDLDTSLDIITANFGMGKLTVTEACKLADRTITVHMQRAYPEGWQLRREERFTRFVKEKLVKNDKPSYKVTVD